MITESILVTHVDRWISKAKIRKHITFHSFRHTFAMQLLDKGVDIYTIAALLGHRSHFSYPKTKVLTLIISHLYLQMFTPASESRFCVGK